MSSHMKQTAQKKKTREGQGLTIHLPASLNCALKSISAACVSQPRELGTSPQAPRKQQSHVHTKRIMLKPKGKKQKKCVRVLRINTPPRTDAHTASVRKKRFLSSRPSKLDKNCCNGPYEEHQDIGSKIGSTL